jgi:hypothetical protein
LVNAAVGLPAIPASVRAATRSASRRFRSVRRRFFVSGIRRAERRTECQTGKNHKNCAHEVRMTAQDENFFVGGLAKKKET